MSPAGLLTVREAAEMVRVSRELVYQAIAAGELPCAVIGGVMHVDAGVFDTWVEGRKTLARPEG
jgi:excisionase family DNA binding protein